MPSVGMRRSRRVFGARVLRSGRKLPTEPHEGRKHRESKFQKLLDTSAGGGHIGDCHNELWLRDENTASVDMTAEPKREERNVERKCGIMYRRKRKRAVLTNVEDARFAKKYVRKQWRTQHRAIESFGSHGCIFDSLALVVNESSNGCYDSITRLLTSLLSYMTRVRVGIKQLSEFMRSKPISDAYSSHGVLFLEDRITAQKPCISIVSESGDVMPLFSVNIFAIPPFFMHLQTCISLRFTHLDCLLVRNCENDEEVVNVVEDGVSEVFEMSTGSNGSRINGRQLAKSTLRNFQLRSSRNIKKRSSLRRKRGRPPSSLRAQKGYGGQFSSSSPSRLVRRQTTNTKAVKSNINSSAPASVIPIPGVQELTTPINQCLQFVRPDSYIVFKDDELIRALTKKTANYDIDSEDEEWLVKPNDYECMTPEKFEMVVDAFEKHVYCNSDEQLDEVAAVDLCMHLERREVIEDVFKYWIRKRKQKRSALVKVFQLYQPRKSNAIPNYVLRKKRSFKRQASQDGRGKQRPLFKVEERDGGLEEKNSGVDSKLEEAKGVAEKYEGVACEKRERAQLLMENADLATYYAIMALKIAEAAQVVEEEEAAPLILGGPTIQSNPILLLELSPSN